MGEQASVLSHDCARILQRGSGLFY
ncbi:hypothetical protein CICLE_v100302842mg, partial [Citrus x clementina]